MILHDVAQHSEQWHRLRAGIPTASEFSKIITPGGKVSRQAETYLHGLLAEWVLGAPITGPETDWMARGIELEDEAIKAFEFHSDLETDQVGFVTTNDGMIGCSPDRLVGKDRLLEIKCPKPSTHVGYMLTGKLEDDYNPQLQGQLWVTERQRVDIVSYCPQMPPVIIPVERDEDYIALLNAALGTFVEVMLAKRAELEKRYGPFVRSPPQQTEDGLGITDQDLDTLLAHHGWAEATN